LNAIIWERRSWAISYGIFTKGFKV
jgi:hypothetical protein